MYKRFTGVSEANLAISRHTSTKMAANSSMLKGPVMEWSTNEGLYSRFKLWKQQCELLFTGPLVKIDEAILCKYLLYWSGERGIELFNSWDLSDGDAKVLKSYWEGFENAVKPHSNELMSAWELHNFKQGDKSIEEFISKLRVLIKEANHPPDLHERFLRDYFVFGLNSSRVRKECLKEGNKLTFTRAKDLAKAEESAENQLKIMNQGDVHAIHKQRKPGKPEVAHHYQHKTEKPTQPKLHRQFLDKNTAAQNKCMGCGRNSHPRNMCPAKDISCHYCHKKGHFAKVCMKKKRVHEVSAEQVDDTHTIDDVVFLGPITATPITSSNVNIVACKQKALLEVQISASERGMKTNVVCKIDSGAETNILPKSIYDKLHPSKPSLRKSMVKLTAYGGTNIPTVGSCDVYVQGPKSQTPQLITVEVANVNGPTIIGNMTAQSLNLIKLTWSVEAETHSVNTQSKQHPYPLTKDYLLKEYEDVFTGIGCFPGPEYHIKLDPDVTPVQHPPRQVPVHLQPAYKSELARLVELGILKEVKDEYTPWINSAVVTPKSNGSIRVCLDPRNLNQAIKCNRHYVRSIDDVIPKVTGTTHFSILDARSGYWQVKIDEESSKLCTFNTPWGKYRWTRLPFGLTCSGDVFQEKMDSIFGSLEGVSGIADDTLIFGSSETKHDGHILNVLNTARENNVRFNPEKFQFKVAEASFFGLKWTPNGLKTDEKKVQAIVDMQPPENLKELQSFMGMVNYLNRFSPVLAQVAQPIRNLLKRDTPYLWQAEQQEAFQKIKDTISKSPILAYYDPEKENLIQSDASMSGLGCVLLQDGKPVCYASRSLTDAESRYSNIERELLAACWSLEKFHHYVYGKKAVIETDHKPLESIWKKSIASASPRLQRLLLRMSKYNINVVYIPGKTNVVADALSRVCFRELPSTDCDNSGIEVDAITQHLPATPAKLKEICDATSEDITLSHLKDVIYRGWPEYMKDCPNDLKEYWNFREDLSVESGLVLKGHRLVIPEKLRPGMLELIHQGHLGVEKSLLKAKDCIFWPGISNDIKELSTSCATCIQYAKQQQKQPLQQHSLPSYPWQKLASDLFDFKGSQYLVLADYYSKFPIVRKLSSTTSAAIINQLKSIFAEYGIPETIVTDNGPQYSSKEFKAFCSTWSINHTTSSPVYPRSNGFSERMVQTVKNILQKADASGEDLYLGLLAYRTTPVDSKLPAPAKLLNRRTYRTQLPTSGRLQRSIASDSDMEQLQHRQQVQKLQHDRKSTRELQSLRPGQAVAVYNPRSKEWNPAKLTKECDEPRSYIVKTPSGSELRRNRVHLKPCTESNPQVSAPGPTQIPAETPRQPSASQQPATPTASDTSGASVQTRSGRTVRPPQRLNL